MSNKSQNPISLPENLRQKFAALERRLWRVETAAAVCVGLMGLLGAFAVLFFLDRFVETPAALRATLLAVAIAVAVLAAGWWAVRWIFSRRDWRALSLIVQRRFRRLGDRLLGIVELSSESQHDANYSPELYRAAIQQVADETAPFDFTEAVETRPAKRLMIATAGLSLLVLLPFLVVPALGKNVFHRLVAPLAAVPRHTLVQLEVPGKIIVPHGEKFALNGTVKFRSFWKPSKAVARFGTQNPVAAKVNGGKIAFQIPAQIQDGKLRVKVGDATREVAVVPTYRPALKEISASIQLPEYLQALATNQAIHNGVLTLLEGSKFSLRGKVSRELESAETRFGEKVESLRTEKDEFLSEVFTSHPRDAGATQVQYAFNWRDNLGLSNAAPWKLSVRTQKDLAPSPNLPDMPSDVAMLDTDVLEIRAQARDDYGVRDLGLNWEFEVDPLRPTGSATTEVKIQPNGRHKKELEKVFRWSPAIYRIPADTSVDLLAFAGDYFPERERVQSRVHRIHILGKEQHAELIRQRLESLLARVEEIARLEEKIMANTATIAEETADKMSAAQSERIGKADEDQERNAKNLEQMAQEGMKTLHEALKNSVFTEQALQEWAKNLQEMQKLAQQEMKSASESLKSARKNSDGESRKKDLAEAQKKQQEVLDALEKMQGKVNKDLDDLQALTLAERLRRVGATETEISGELQKVVPETIGLLPKELPEKFKNLGMALLNRQEMAHTESAQLQKEINRFFERTQKPNYGEVSKEITEAKTVEEMERVGFLIKDNIAMEATKNLAEWAGRFEKWADKLEPPKEESDDSGSGGGEGSESPNDMTKTLVALLRLRENEIVLREQTRLLDGERGDEANYKERAGTLSEAQKKLTSGLNDLAQENKIPMLRQPYQQTGEAMTEIESLLQKPQTDETTLATQIKSVDLLTDLINLINEQAKRQNPKPQQGEGEGQTTAEQMAFLMQMMSQPGKPGEAMTPGPAGGGNKSGGTTDRADENFDGAVSGESGENRRVEKASGAGSISLPTEFRETLESYFKAIEEEGN